MSKRAPVSLGGVLRLVLIALIIALMLVLLPSPQMVLAEVVPLPIDQTGGIPPYPWGYTGDSDYEDGSIAIHIEHGRWTHTNWTTVTIKVQDPSQVRTFIAGPYGSTQELPAATMAKRVQSVLAIGGDYFCLKPGGYIVRQGNFYRDKPSGRNDVLVIDRKGDLQVLFAPDRAAISAYEKEHKDEVVNAFTFGPVLVHQGQRVDKLPRGRNETVRAQRIALCQTGPLSYRVVYCEGPNDNNSKGLIIEEFADLVASFPDVITAFNLDGGSSANIIFREVKINGPDVQRNRAIGDIIYFASAWVEPPREEPTTFQVEDPAQSPTDAPAEGN